ncbi:MAG: hypothetical protein U1E49_21775 [Hyphomicrobiaceae bacterium]
MTVRKAQKGGAPLSDALKLMPWGAGHKWSPDGELPGHTGDSIVGAAILKLLSGRFIQLSPQTTDIGFKRFVKSNELRAIESIEKLSRNNRNDDSWMFMQGYKCAQRIKGHENAIRVSLADGFFAAQDTLGFSLSELSRRNERSVIATPLFSPPTTKRFDVFVIMPFDPAFRTIYDQTIAVSALSAGRSVGRGDDFFGSNYVIDDIWSSIYNAEFIIADCTSRNANVFYELGISHTLGRNTLIITQSEVDIPFDLRHWRYHVYQTNSDGLSRLSIKVREFLC